MKHLFIFVAVTLVATMFSGCNRKTQDNNWQTLFNGSDLTGWDTYVGPTYDTIQNKFDTLLVPGLNNDPRKIFSVTNEDSEPAIRISGDGFGGISTLQEFENYHLRVEFKWGDLRWPPRKDKKRDSGILYHATGPQGAGSGFWLRSQECQVQEGDCGDYWSVDKAIVDIPAVGEKIEAYVYDANGEMHPFSTYGSSYGPRCIKNPDAEKPVGEWNVVDIFCLGGNSIHMINGTVVMKLFNSRQPMDGKEIPLTKGKIQIQTEGAEIFYRNIQVEPITELPKE